ncbi:MAG: hypothetical protein ACU0DH_08090, partial [Paracoccus sp. (in: a-proteobacteria)]
MSNLFWLTEAQMARLRPFFPKSHSRPRVDDRKRRLRPIDFLIAVARSGAWLSCFESSPGSPGRGHCEVVFCWAEAH